MGNVVHNFWQLKMSAFVIGEGSGLWWWGIARVVGIGVSLHWSPLSVVRPKTG